MITLPQTLADWMVELDCFSDTLQTALGPWLPQLAALVGSPRRHRAESDGEPEGFDGLTNRGRYERLLLSEWLLVDEEPLEFMRRAATGQHLFNALARKTPTESRCCLVLLDTGPSQLGAPRLAQLALLIVLARRARRSNTRLLWGIVQTPGELMAGLDEAGVRKFLAARTLELPEPGWLELWTEHLREIDLSTDERWLIGDGSNALAFGRTTTTISILEQAPEFRQLLVEVRNPVGRQAARSRLLELPSDQLALQMIRNPFRAAGRPRGKQNNKRHLSCMVPPRIWLDPRGRRVFVRTHDGSVAAYHVPPKCTHSPGRARVYECRDGEHVLAAGMRGKRIMALTYTPERVCLRRYLSHGGDLCCGPPSDPDVAEALAAAARTPAADGTLSPHGMNRHRYLTPTGVLLELQGGADKPELTIVVLSKSVGVDPQSGSADEQVLGAVVHQGLIVKFSLTERRMLSRRKLDQVEVVHRFSNDVIATAFGEECGLIALLTDNFELHVYSIDQRVHLVRHQLEGPP